MGSSSKSSSAATSNEVADSYNTITTTSVTPTASGDNSAALGLGNSNTLNGKLNFMSNSGNDSNNETDSNNYSASYGANGSAGNSSGSMGTTSSGFDWSEVIVWVVGGVALMFVLRALGDKNA